MYHRVLRTVHYAITPSVTDRHQGKNHGLKINGRKKKQLNFSPRHAWVMAVHLNAERLY